MHTISTTISLAIPKNQSLILPIKSSIKRISQNTDLKASKNTNEENISECVNENLNSVQDIIEHFQHYS
jgi:hypothetical protein